MHQNLLRIRHASFKLLLLETEIRARKIIRIVSRTTFLISHPQRMSPEVAEKILAIQTEYQSGALRITYYLGRYHGLKISESTVSRILKAHGINRLPKTARRRALHTRRYAKTVPGHHVQVDVQFLQLKDREGKTGTNTQP